MKVRMNAITSLSKDALIENLKTLVREERRITLEILHHLREVEGRKLHLELGFPILFEYVTRELGFSEGAAFRRISAMRAIRDLPELEPAIESGKLTVSTVSQVQSFLRSEKLHHKSYTPEEKQALFRSVQNMSSREVERELAARAPELVQRERERPLDHDRTEIRFGRGPKAPR
jgi:hypothetical protein